MIYIKIIVESPEQSNEKSRSLIGSVLSIFLPKANPDFDRNLYLVKQWLLEFKDENSTPNREVGLNDSCEVLMKMPDHQNYGYWTDNNLKLNDFKKRFDIDYINEAFFNEKWNSI